MASTLQIFPITQAENNKNALSLNDEMIFSQPSIQQKDSYLSVTVDEAKNYLTVSGEPMLPVYTKTYDFPLGTKILKVDCKLQEIHESEISGKIEPAPEPIPKISVSTNVKNNAKITENEEVYSSSDFYPNNWYGYKTTCGLKGEERVIYVTVSVYPVRYSPKNNLISKLDGADIEIKYEPPSKEISFADKYDMVIIAPQSFSSMLQRLVNHKNDIGIRTFLETTEEIYSEYNGVDKAEKIKYFINDSIVNDGIKYVLLVGGRIGQRDDWYVPARYSNLDDWGGWERSFVSDLYYADVYKYNETSEKYEFDNWDSNGNGKFAEWYIPGYKQNDNQTKDILDLVPDVYLGRLACRNKNEVRTVVNKIIYYEDHTYEKRWFKNIILVGGDTVPDSSSYYEGEIETSYGASFLEPLGFKTEELFASTENLTTSSLIRAIDRGAGFLYLSGHANPVVWSTHPPNSDDNTWIDALYNYDMRRLINMGRLPICVVGGCHNNQFDVELLNFFKGLKKEGPEYFNVSWDYDQGSFWKLGWAPECWGWNLVKQKYGGSIATIGYTGLGFGLSDKECLDRYDGWMTTHFFKNYANLSQLGNNTLGEIHAKTITDYITQFRSDGWGRGDAKTVEGWALLGDPSLIIGGYHPVI